MYSRRGKGRSNSKDLVLPALPLMLRKSMPHAQPTQHHHHCCAVGRCDGTAPTTAPATARHCAQRVRVHCRQPYASRRTLSPSSHAACPLQHSTAPEHPRETL